MNNKTKKILGLSLLLTTTITVVCALAPNPLEISTRLFASNNKQTYSFVKTDFSISELPVIPSDNKSFGYSPMVFTENDGIFVSDVGDPSDVNTTTTGIGWSTDDAANGCKVTREGNFFSLETVTPSPYSPSDANRELGVNIKIDIIGDREILLTDNTYYLFDLYYVAQIVNEEEIIKREMKITPEYYYDHSSVFFSLDTFKSDYSWKIDPYGEIPSCGVYKITLKAISIEYSCSK